MNIVNFLQVEEYIYSSGQPTSENFHQIAAMGFKSVINLALPSSDGAISDEGAVVTSTGMNYFHIPVEWNNPTESQFRLFSAIMESHKSDKVWVHCALNMRVSSFIYLYRIIYCGVKKNEALESMQKIWSPNDKWSAFIEHLENNA